MTVLELMRHLAEMPSDAMVIIRTEQDSYAIEGVDYDGWEETADNGESITEIDEVFLDCRSDATHGGRIIPHESATP